MILIGRKWLFVNYQIDFVERGKITSVFFLLRFSSKMGIVSKKFMFCECFCTLIGLNWLDGFLNC